ncbi:MAG TPA: hypothetical protein VG458_10950, partial [Solirubrobacterales bacterium]|nr:hypothetical protein [Solirubrobacterales bacterium]
VGGDEFAALLDCPPERLPSACERAAEALTAAGDGYDLGASWGTVAVPTEAATAPAAMKLADVRMYAQKQSRQVAAGPTILTAGTAALRVTRDGEAVEQRA